MRVGKLEHSENYTSGERILAVSVLSLLFFMLPVSTIAPRFMAYAPALIGLIGFIGWFSVYKVRPVFPKKVVIISLAVLGLGLLSVLWSVAPDFSMERTSKIALIMLGGCLCFSFVASLRPGLINQYIWLFPIFCGVAVLINLIEVLFDMPLHRLARGKTYDDKMPGAIMNRSIICAVAVSFLAFGVIKSHDFFAKVKKPVLYSLAGLIVVLLMLSQGQSAQLAFLVGALAFLFFPVRSKFAWRFLAGLIFILILTAPWTVQLAYNNYAALLNEYAWFQNGYAANRLEIWDFIARYALESPLVGYGLEATRHITDFESAKIYHASNHILHPHNFALQIWIEFGLWGVCALCVLIGYVLHQISQLHVQIMRLALSTFIFCLSVASTAYGIWQSWWLGELLLALSLFALVAKSLGAEEEKA